MTHPTDLDTDFEERARVLDRWVDLRRQIAILEAEAAETLIAQITIHDRDVAEHSYHREAIYRSMVGEFSAAGRMSKGSVEFAFGDARALAEELPATRAAFGEGRITAAHVREIVRASFVISEAVRNKRADAEMLHLYEAAVLVVAEQDTAARTRPHARHVAAALVGDTVVERERRAVQERTVTVRSLDDGLALLSAVLPEWIAYGIQDRLTGMARHITRSRGPRSAASGARAIFSTAANTFALDPDDENASDLDGSAVADGGQLPPDVRTMDQIRADVFSDMLLAGKPSDVIGTDLESVQGHVQVTIAATSLAGLDDRPAELDGHGTLSPEIARALAGRNGGWTRLFLDAAGNVTETDTYSPTAGMRRHLRARDRHCRFPGCRMPVHRCEIDHNQDHAKGGKTALDNLAHFCVSHHTLKHPDVPEPHRWAARQLPDGTVTWTSPLGRTYLDRPPRRVMFT